MPKYLIQSSLTQEGVKGVLKEGGTKRREAVQQAVKALGGTVEAYYYAFGASDNFIIVDLPDNVTAVAASMISNAAGTSKMMCTVLVTPEEVDQAAKKGTELGAAYRPPGR